jgi:4-hydroxy-2-oxoheptanedioate aldolase
MSAHPLLQAFKANKAAFGAWLTLPGVFHARTIAQASPHLSWIVIDCEHGLVPLVPGAAESIASIQATRKAGVNPPSVIVRVPGTGITTSTSWQIKNALDAGAQGVIIPMVSTAVHAQTVVADSNFPPRGRRGFGSPFTHGVWGVTSSEYLESANDGVVVMVQIENKEAVENVQEIAEVPGVDVLFIGPYDLSLSLGYPKPDPDPHPEVEQVIQKILKAAHAAGKKCAIYCSSGAQGAIRASEGFDMINVANDMAALSEGIAKEMAAALGQ